MLYRLENGYKSPSRQNFGASALSGVGCCRPNYVMIQFMLLISRQGKLRMKKWFVPCPENDQFRQIKEISSLVLSRGPKVCNFLEWRDSKICYKRYASLFFLACVEATDNELDLIFNFHKPHYVLDEIVIAGEIQESSKRAVLHSIADQDKMVQQEENAKPSASGKAWDMMKAPTGFRS